MEENYGAGRLPHFHPALEGCVTRDPCFAKALCESYMEELAAVGAYTYRALVIRGRNQRLSELFERIAREEMVHFRLLGELILALGGNPAICTHLRIGMPEGCCAVGCEAGFEGRAIADSLREERRGIDRYQTLMGCTRDRVVRSVLTQIIDDEQAHVEAIRAMATEQEPR